MSNSTFAERSGVLETRNRNKTAGRFSSYFNVTANSLMASVNDTISRFTFLRFGVRFQAKAGLKETLDRLLYRYVAQNQPTWLRQQRRAVLASSKRAAAWRRRQLVVQDETGSDKAAKTRRGIISVLLMTRFDEDGKQCSNPHFSNMHSKAETAQSRSSRAAFRRRCKQKKTTNKNSEESRGKAYTASSSDPRRRRAVVE